MPEKTLKIGILETGRLPDELIEQFSNYPDMFGAWLAPTEAEFRNYAALDGVLPSNPDECDLWLITGSRFGAYEDHDWIPPLEQFIRDCRDAGQKMLGICFGHQLIAQALGGRVEKSPKGWGLGVHKYSVADWPEQLGTPPDGLEIQAFHQDQVTELPSGGTRIASSEFCENAGIWYPGFALTVQGHPEFSKPFASALMESRRGTLLKDDEVDQALCTMANDTTRHELALFVRDHLDSI